MKFSSPGGRRSLARRGLAMTAVAGLTLGVFLGAPGGAHADTPNGNKDIVLGVGSDASQRTLAWYSLTGDPQSVVFGTDAELTSSADVSVPVTPVANTQGATTQFNVHTTLTGLAPNSTYYYKVGSTGGGFSPIFSFKTGAVGFGDGFGADFFGDPQIGASGQAALDGDGWVQTVKFAQAHDTDTELYLSGGDQIDTTSATTTTTVDGVSVPLVEYQWDQFSRIFNRGALAGSSDIATGTQIPWASTIGNHDVSTKTYQQHLAQPNLDSNSRYYAGNTTATQSGGDYWFTYRDVLFIDINSNSYNAGSGTSATSTGDTAHLSYIRNVIDAHGAGAKYKVLIYHHAIYSPADHANDTDNAQRRSDFTTAFSQLGVNLVLQGHDHSYSRSYAIKNGSRTDAAAQLQDGAWAPESSDAAGNPDGTTILPGPGGVIYVTANSASGSKYYDLTEPNTAKNNGDYGADPNESAAQAASNPGVSGGHVNHWANAVENQEHVPTYLRINFGTDKITVDDVRSGDCATSSANAAVTRGNVGWCGATGNTWSGASKTSDGSASTGAVTTPATPTDSAANNAWNLAHPAGSLVDKFVVQQVVAPSGLAISGTRAPGKTVTASVASVTPGASVSYVWKANGVQFATGPSVTLTPAQGGKSLTVTATADLGQYGGSTSTTSAAVPVALATLKSATPSISGTVKVGKLLSAKAGSWTPGTTLTYAWYAGTKKVGSGSSLKLTNSLKGKKITVKVTGSHAGYATVTKASKATKSVKKK